MGYVYKEDKIIPIIYIVTCKKNYEFLCIYCDEYYLRASISPTNCDRGVANNRLMRISNND